MTAHGGDIYRQDVELDFSVNENPCGMPEGVKEALRQAVEECVHYPDPEAEALRGKLAGKLQAAKAHILVGNGASELFPAIVRAIAPEKTVIPVPSFGGYEYAVFGHLSYQGSDRLQGRDGDQSIVYYKLVEDNNFAVTEEILDELGWLAESGSMDAPEGWGKKLLFLAQPNNPVGNLLIKIKTHYAILLALKST